jgi:hypothetical protein
MDDDARRAEPAEIQAKRLGWGQAGTRWNALFRIAKPLQDVKSCRGFESPPPPQHYKLLIRAEARARQADSGCGGRNRASRRMSGLPRDVDGQLLENVKRLLVAALARISALRAENAALRAEIARLKELKGPPSIKPSGMEKATEPRPSAGGAGAGVAGPSGLVRRSKIRSWWRRCRRGRASRATRLISSRI